MLPVDQFGPGTRLCHILSQKPGQALSFDLAQESDHHLPAEMPTIDRSRRALPQAVVDKHCDLTVGLADGIRSTLSKIRRVVGITLGLPRRDPPRPEKANFRKYQMVGYLMGDRGGPRSLKPRVGGATLIAEGDSFNAMLREEGIPGHRNKEPLASVGLSGKCDQECKAPL